MIIGLYLKIKIKLAITFLGFMIELLFGITIIHSTYEVLELEGY